MKLVEQLRIIKNQQELKNQKKEVTLKQLENFDLNDDSYLDFQIHRTTDRNYLNTYKYRYEDTLNSFLKIRNHRNLNFSA